MGREAEGEIRFGGAAGHGRVLVESAEIILRGDVRARLPRQAIRAVRVEGDDLVIETVCGPVVATLGAEFAAHLCRALLKPVPALVDKLGIGDRARAGCLWPVTDAVLAGVLAGLTAPVDEAAVLVAEIMDEAALARLMAWLPGLAGRHVWCVNAKAPHPGLPEARIRAALRAAGWIDSKTTAVSDRMSATRYTLRPRARGLAAPGKGGHMKAKPEPRRTI